MLMPRVPAVDAETNGIGRDWLVAIGLGFVLVGMILLLHYLPWE